MEIRYDEVAFILVTDQPVVKINILLTLHGCHIQFGLF
jgi:hypothetical protein